MKHEIFALPPVPCWKRFTRTWIVPIACRQSLHTQPSIILKCVFCTLDINIQNISRKGMSIVMVHRHTLTEFWLQSKASKRTRHTLSHHVNMLVSKSFDSRAYSTLHVLQISLVTIYIQIIILSWSFWFTMQILSTFQANG